MSHDTDVVIVGGGAIGLACAWRLAAHGARVTVLDPTPIKAATHAAAGMLAPVSEAGYAETALLRLAAESLRRYPGFVAELEAATGTDVGLRSDGTLVIAADSGDRAELIELHRFHAEQGVTSQLVTSREARRLEPGLAPGIRSGLLVDGDLSIDNRRLATALLDAARDAGVTVVQTGVERVNTTGNDANGAVCTGVTTTSGDEIPAATTILAAGSWSRRIAGIPAQAIPPVRPVKGQILRLAGHPDLIPQRSIRALVNGREVYLVPRHTGELVIGATVEDRGFDTTVTAGAVHELLHDARAVWPAVDELELTETFASLRPGSPDNTPIVGRTSVTGLIVATGHHRNGILLTPITADIVTALIDGADSQATWAALVTPSRFSASTAAQPLVLA